MFEGLKFRWEETPIHRLHPVVKLLFAIGISSAALFFRTLPILLLLFASQVAIIALARVGRTWSRTLLGAGGVAILVFLIGLGLSISRNYFRSRAIFPEAIFDAVMLTVTWIVFFAAFSTYFLTTSPEDLSVALEQAHLPAAFCFSAATAVRFVPVLANDLEHIMDAQRSRGVDFDTLNPLKRIANLLPLILPLIANAIRRSLDLEEALDSKAFGAAKRRTHLYELQFGLWDFLLLIGSLLLILVSLYFGWFLPIFH